MRRLRLVKGRESDSSDTARSEDSNEFVAIARLEERLSQVEKLLDEAREEIKEGGARRELHLHLDFNRIIGCAISLGWLIYTLSQWL